MRAVKLASQSLPRQIYTAYKRLHTMSTPIFACDPSSVVIESSAPPLHRLQSPSFSVPQELSSSLSTASEHLHAGRTVAFPTETVYGLGAHSLNPSAVKRIYAIKNRPSDNPLIIHVSSLDMLSSLLPESYKLSKLYLALIDAFWPGPLTLLFPSPNPPPLPAPQTNAIRMPHHPLALALIHKANLPLSAPSANSSGRPSPTQAQHVWNDLNGAEGLGCILDGGPCGVGVESTVVNGLGWLEGGGGFVDVLRPGGLGVEEVERIVRQVDRDERTQILFHGKPWSRASASSSSNSTPSVPSSEIAPATPQSSTPKVELLPSTPGMKYRHYSPRVPVYLLLPSNIFPRPPSLSVPSSSKEILQHIVTALTTTKGGKRPKLGLLHYDSSPLSHAILGASLEADIKSVSLGTNASSAAQRLFSGMLALEGRKSATIAAVTNGQAEDSEGVDAILIEGCSNEGLGLAVMERVGKAVGGGGKSGELGNGQGVGTKGRFWIEV